MFDDLPDAWYILAEDALLIEGDVGTWADGTIRRWWVINESAYGRPSCYYYGEKHARRIHKTPKGNKRIHK